MVEKEAHLLELCRYIVLNPVRAGMVKDVSQWRWSSYHQMFSMNTSEQWMAIAHVLGLFSAQADIALEQYQSFVANGTADRPWDKLRGQVFLGSEDFLSRSEAMLSKRMLDPSVSLTQRHPARPTSLQVLQNVAQAFSLEVAQVLDRRVHREAYSAGVFLLRRTCNMSLKEVASLADISPARVSQIQSETNYDQLPDHLKVYKVKR
ncbi:hypothetical protein JYT48_00340 [Mariprofundus ferrooxydans]|nr:hypothetical protein [Mariprofundus ferrooxydans]